MTNIRPFTFSDILRFNDVNLDPLTETYNLNFYMQYLFRWPEYFWVAEGADGAIEGYIMGKSEGRPDTWHGHVTAVSVAPSYRNMGIARRLMDILEDVSEKKKCYFVDLFVRVSNKKAIAMYERLGYTVYRRVLDYYSGAQEEDAFDMRKSLSRDPDKRFMIPLGRPVRPDELDSAGNW